MFTIKWTQPSGAINIIESKNACVLLPETKAWGEYKEDSDIISGDVRAIVMYDGGTIHIHESDPHLYIVNENGKTVQTV